MKPLVWKRWRLKLLWIALLVFVWLLCSGQARADGLTERLAAFPHWTSKPALAAAEGDLVYPQWLAGTWRVQSTLVDMVAPLAPTLVTPGFTGNRQFLNKPIEVPIRFVLARVGKGRFLNQALKVDEQIVSDRVFNSLSLARAYLGEDEVKTVRVDPDNPNRQVTWLGDDRQLVSVVSRRGSEHPSDRDFVTSEVFQQFFQGGSSGVYLNEVENTTAYHRQVDGNPAITADQVTAIYLSPRDPDYFKALNRPVALYRYRMEFSRE
jgi:hypothetical protein